ncbi:hypothetical protein SBRCBS47491_000776 [Sporothrix bragantina]|uniref:Uncharacterized protein n=1 Tax=Sporothrix bragantina TaxID=671064 RepID=A0ABP0AT22_9PEZI
MLMACLESTRTFFTVWLALPAALYHRLLMTVFALVAHATVALGMLNVLPCHGWDRAAVREMAPLLPVLDSLGQKYEVACRETDDGPHSGCSPFLREESKMQRLKRWYEAKLKGEQVQTENDDGCEDKDKDEGVDQLSMADFELDEMFWVESIDWMGLDLDSFMVV